MMAILSVIRPYRNVLMALVVTSALTTACKNSGGSGSEIDPRDQYVGTYDGGDAGYNSTITIGTLPFTEKGPALITVSKSANPKEIYIDIANRPPRLTAELTNGSFTVVDRTTDQIRFIINGQQNTIEGNYSGTGAFGKDQASGKDVIAISATTEALRSGTKVTRLESINGLKK